MKATDAYYSLGVVRAAVCATYPQSPARAEIVSRLMAVESALVQPASLCSREELFDAAICDEPDEEGEPSLMDDLLEQITTGALVAYLAQRQAREEERRLARILSSVRASP